MKLPKTPTVLGAFCAGMMIVTAAAADRDMQAAATPQVALQPAASADAGDATGNCLLPGQIHKFGGIKTVTPRRAVTLSADDCAARGGEVIAAASASN